MKSTLAAWSVLAGVAIGCGGDTAAAEAESACLRIVDAYAKAWERCGRETYDGARQFWEEALVCDTVEAHDGPKVDECVGDLEAQQCAAVESNASPTTCTNALTGG